MLGEEKSMHTRCPAPTVERKAAVGSAARAGNNAVATPPAAKTRLQNGPTAVATAGRPGMALRCAASSAASLGGGTPLALAGWKQGSARSAGTPLAGGANHWLTWAGATPRKSAAAEAIGAVSRSSMAGRNPMGVRHGRKAGNGS